ncbi:hypothetical protein DID78_02960 [Candidatus Marinamargulisbacteria bacterium SCGC AG-343-D04]|nr:hypothetical protein DID78_02960 [Candidatus Marinamargulisbacteria bacterium SCGC AG-343-D04]
MIFDHIHLVFLVALKQEVPDNFEGAIPTVSLKALKSQDFRRLTESQNSMLCIVTGVGKINIQDAVLWVSTNLSPLMVINFGLAGSRHYHSGDLVMPTSVSYKSNRHPLLFSKFPFHSSAHVISGDNCETVDDVSSISESSLVDMESYWVVESCLRYDLPVYILKCVSDSNSNDAEFEFQQNLAKCSRMLESCFESLLNPKPCSISVIIPTFNRYSTLKRAIDSVLKQTKESECIVVDDASTDDTKSLVKNYDESLVRYVALSENKGVSYARNCGVQAATGNWIAFLDSDDEWLPKKLEHHLSFLDAHPYYHILQCEEQWVRHGKHFNKKKYHQKREGFIFDSCLERCMISPSAVFFRKSFFLDYGGFDESLEVCEDYDLWLKMSRDVPVGLHSDVDLIKYGGHSDQLSASSPVMDRFRVKSLAEQYYHETHMNVKKKIRSVLEKKLSILISGAKKRGQETSYYEKIFKSLD